MTDKRTLVRSKENGVEVWGCNACEWARPRRRMIAGGTERREDLHAAFHQHNCEDYPGPRRLAGSTAVKEPRQGPRSRPVKAEPAVDASCCGQITLVIGFRFD